MIHKKSVRKKIWLVLIILLIILLTVVLVLIAKKSQSQKKPVAEQSVQQTNQPRFLIPDKNKIFDLKIDATDSVLGNPDAKITVVEFGDYQCPNTGALSGQNKDLVAKIKAADSTWEPMFPNLQKEYIDTGKVKFIFKDFTFLDDQTDNGGSHLAAQAAHCAGDQGKYWEFGTYLLSHQKGEGATGGFTKDDMRNYAKLLDLNATSFNDCFDKGTYAKKVNQSTTFGLSINIHGVPIVFVNGKLVTNLGDGIGALSYSFYKKAIEKELNSYNK